MNTSVSTLHKFQTLAILVLIFADGCDVGQFSLSSFDVWSIGGIINVLLHALAGFLIMGFGIQFFYSPQRLAPRIWVSVPVGVHSPGDWMVVIAITAGALLWFATLLVERAQSVRVRREAIA